MTHPENVDVLVANGPSEVLDADQDEHVTLMHISALAKTAQMATNISA